MKKGVCFTAMIILAASLALCQSAAAGAGRKISVAASFGSYPVPFWVTFPKPHAPRYGLEIGYQISGRLRLSGEFQYVDWSAYSRTYATDTDDFQWSKTSYGSTPILLSLIYVTPIDKTFTFFLGAGAGYHPFTVKYRHGQHLGGEDIIDSTTKDNGHGIVPHFSFGIETVLFKQVSVLGQVRQVLGSFRYKTIQDVTGESRFTNSGVELLAGVRLYF